MKKLTMIAVIAAAVTLMSSQSQAYCIQAGIIISVFVTPGAGPSAIDVRSVEPGSVQYRYTTSDSKLINAALCAETSHAHVQLTGGAPASVCGPVGGGLSGGGALASIIVGDVI